MNVKNPFYYLLTLGFIFLWSQCDTPQFENIDHPFELAINDTVAVPITIRRGEFPVNLDSLLPASLSGKTEMIIKAISSTERSRSGNYLWLGIQLPQDWAVIDDFDYVAYDSLPATIIDSGLFVYSPAHVTLLDTSDYTLEPGNKWMAWVSADTMKMQYGKLWTNPVIISDENTGYYRMSYMLGYNNLPPCSADEYRLTIASQQLDTSWVVNNNDSGEGSLRDAVLNVKSGGKVLFSMEEQDTIHLSEPIHIFRPMMINENDSANLVSINGPDTSGIFILDHLAYRNYNSNYYQSTGMFHFNLFDAGKAAITVSDVYNFQLHNLQVHDNAGPGLMLNGWNTEYSQADLTDCSVFNNTGENGGGISVNHYELNIQNSTLHENMAENGGGIYLNAQANVNLNNVIVRENIAENNGGGIYSGWDSYLYHDALNLVKNQAGVNGGGLYSESSEIYSYDYCNIYLNKAAEGRDLYSYQPMTVYADTFTVKTPTEYFASPFENFTFYINHGYVQQVAADLFVSPDGDNKNSGLNEEEPLKNIYYAITKQLTDSAEQRTITLHDGTYSPSANNEFFPVVLPDFIDLKGTSNTSVFLDAEGTGNVIQLRNNSNNRLSDLTITGGQTKINADGGGIYCYYSDPVFENLVISNNTSESQGGGMYIYFSDPVIKNVLITGNDAFVGGGFWMTNAHPGIQDVIITGNTSSWLGGGIYFGSGIKLKMQNTTITYNESNKGGGIYFSNALVGITAFSDTNRCNVYFNKAFLGNDIYSSIYTRIVLDTFTVMHPGDFYVESERSLSFDIWNAKIDQVNADLYVSPHGDNSNNGLTSGEPLKNIRNALMIARADKNNTNTVYLMEGTYSPSASGEMMPVNIPAYINLEGVSEEEVILDAEGESGVVHFYNNSFENSLSGLTITGGKTDYGGGIYCYKSSPVLKHLIVDGNEATQHGGGIFGQEAHLNLINSLLNNNVAAEWGGGLYLEYSSPKFHNVKIHNNSAGIVGGGLSIWYSNAELRNLLITGNSSSEYGGGICLVDSESDLYNLTISDNTAIYGGGILSAIEAETDLRNSILWNNIPDEIQIYSDGGGYYDQIDVSNSDIKGGLDSITNQDSGTVNWLEGNINEDPEFSMAGIEELHYVLTGYSPCIDAGTPDVSGLNLPEFDLLGNLRIWDGNGDGSSIVDMGAYEFASMPVIVEPATQTKSFDVVCFPNPVMQSAVIEYTLEEPSNVQLKIINYLGKEVETIVNGTKSDGKNRIIWNADPLPAGVYFLRLQAGDEIVTKKVVKY